MPTTFTTLYPSAHDFEEPEKYLFKCIAPYECLGCGRPTVWLSYEWLEQPVPVCGPYCRQMLRELAIADI